MIEIGYFLLIGYLLRKPLNSYFSPIASRLGRLYYRPHEGTMWIHTLYYNVHQSIHLLIQPHLLNHPHQPRTPIDRSIHAPIHLLSYLLTHLPVSLLNRVSFIIRTVLEWSIFCFIEGLHSGVFLSPCNSVLVLAVGTSAVGSSLAGRCHSSTCVSRGTV